MNRPPRPATRAEVIQRANVALPPGLKISWRRGPDRARPYRVLLHGHDVGGCASLEAAIFAALRRRSDLHLPVPKPAEVRYG